MTLIRSLPLNGLWGDTQALQTETQTVAASAYPNGLPGAIEWVVDPMGARGTVMRSTLLPYSSGPYGNRSELYCSPEPVSAGVRCNRWYKWSMLIDSSEWLMTDRYVSVMQIHDEPDIGDGARWPNLIIYAGAGELRVMLPRINPPTDGDSTSRVAAAIPLPLDRWFDVQVGVNLSQESEQGWWCITADNKLMLREQQHGTAYVDVDGPIFKLGLYNIFKHTTPAGDAPIARAYYTACEHHEAPYAPGTFDVLSYQSA